MSISVVVPIHNELDNLDLLFGRLTGSLDELNLPYEILLVDDGSTDGSTDKIRELARTDDRVKAVILRRNFGQTAAMKAGLDMASGDVIVTLDGDLQNDPDDIALLLSKLDEGFDLVHGWRKERQDAWLHRTFPSRVANWLISRVTGFPIHDLGCTLKAMRREIASELELYGEMHRFIPILAHRRGARCAEVVVQHHPRKFGKTKYGLGRVSRVLLDLVTIKYLLDYFASPMKLFGRFAIGCGLAAFVSGCAVLGMKILGGIDMTGNPLLLLSVVSALASLQFLGLGLIGEVNARIYFSAPGKQSYAVRETLNLDPNAGVVLPARRAA